MNIINIKLGVDTQPCSAITLGRRGENEVTQVAVDFSSWVEEFGAGVITLLAMRSQDTSAYPVVLSLDGNTATWVVTSTDTAYKGSGRAEYIYTVGEQIAKSVVFNTVVMQDIGEPSETPPDPYEDWLERLTELGAETQANADAAQQSAEDAEQSAQEAAQEAANAEGYAEQAGESASAAQSAEAASESARDAAQTAQASAEASATAASGSAASAAGSATAAAGSASDASASATAAGASATTASTAAGQAEAAKTAAQAAQSAAEDAAADAQQAAQQAHVEYEQLSGEVDDLSGEVAQQKSAIEALDALVDCKAGMLVDSVSGAIASFVPDATIDNLLGVSVDIEPVQDLHGYANPWPAGGGKNKFNGTFLQGYWAYANGTWVESNYWIATEKIPCKPSTSYTVSADAKLTRWQGFVWYDANGNYISTDNLQSNENIGLTKTSPSNAAYLVFNIAGYPGTTSIIAPSDVTHFQLEEGSSPTTYSPYSNICPISGWNAVEVEATGINVWDEEWEAGGISDTTGEKIPQSSRIRSKNYIPCVPNTSYCLVSPLTSNDVRIAYYRADFSFISMTPWTVNGAFTTNASAHYMMFLTAGAYGNTYHNDISINYPSTDHAYHPYAGNRYTITLGQTVYSGTLTIAEDGSVTALVDRAGVDMGELTWSPSSANPGVFSSTMLTDHALTTGINILSSKYQAVDAGVYSLATMPDKRVKTNATYAEYIYVKDTSCTGFTGAEFKDAISGVRLVYELATPITIQLDSAQIATIARQTNNVWADAGDVSVEFAADIKAYIDRLNQPTEDDMIANSLIAANKYFTVNNRLFLSTASIAAGAMIIPGTNCTETSLAAALNALNA